MCLEDEPLAAHMQCKHYTHSARASPLLICIHVKWLIYVEYSLWNIVRTTVHTACSCITKSTFAHAVQQARIGWCYGFSAAQDVCWREAKNGKSRPRWVMEQANVAGVQHERVEYEGGIVTEVQAL